MAAVFQSIQTFCVILVLSYVLARVNLFDDQDAYGRLAPPKFALAVAVFLFIALYGTIFDLLLPDSGVFDTRVAGIALSGFLFGPVVGGCVAAATAAVTVLLGTPMMLADLFAIALTFVVASVSHERFPRYDALLSGIIVGAAEIVHMLLIMALVSPVEVAKSYVYTYSYPFVVLSGCAVVLFILIVQDMNMKRRLWERESAQRFELDASARIQRSLLEQDFKVDSRLDLHAHLVPARDVGGDLYGFGVEDGRYFHFLVGDVSGKGIPASITMSRAETAFETLVRERKSPGALLEAVNATLARNNKEMMFVTAVAGMLDLETGRMTYANAGHTLVYAVNGAFADGTGAAVEELERPKGKPLGIGRRASYAEAVVDLRPGWRVVLYSDGITEAENQAYELFGDDRLREVLERAAAAGDDAAAINGRVMDAVVAYRGAAPQSDDIVLFTFGWNGATLAFDFPATIDGLVQAERDIVAALDRPNVPERLRGDVALVMEEITSNIVKYGYPEDDAGEHRIRVEIGRSEDGPLIAIEDDSVPFDPFEEAPRPDLTLPGNRRPVGGLGVHMVRNRLKSYEYGTENGRNRLVIRLRDAQEDAVAGGAAGMADRVGRAAGAGAAGAADTVASQAVAEALAGASAEGWEEL